MVKHTRETWLVILTWLNITHDHVARRSAGLLLHLKSLIFDLLVQFCNLLCVFEDFKQISVIHGMQNSLDRTLLPPHPPTPWNPGPPIFGAQTDTRKYARRARALLEASHKHARHLNQSSLFYGFSKAIQYIFEITKQKAPAQAGMHVDYTLWKAQDPIGLSCWGSSCL